MSDPSELAIAGLAAASSLVGAFVGATLQYLFTRRADRERHRREMVAGVYAAYLNSIGETEAAGDIGPQAVAEAKGRAIAAKARLCVDGSGDVVHALHTFESRGFGDMRKTMIGLVRAMRTDVGAKGHVTEEDVNGILFDRPTG